VALEYLDIGGISLNSIQIDNNIGINGIRHVCNALATQNSTLKELCLYCKSIEINSHSRQQYFIK
jgi:hypothetical protein